MWGLAGGMSMAVTAGASDMWQNTWNMTHDTYHMMYDTWHMIRFFWIIFILLVLLSAYAERFSASCMQDFFIQSLKKTIMHIVTCKIHMENKFEPNTYFYLYSQINFNLNILVFVLGPEKYVLITM